MVTAASGDERRLTPAQDPRELAGQILDLAVPAFADGAGVFVLDSQLAGGVPGADSGDLIVHRLGTRFVVDDGAGEVPSAVFPAWGVVTFAAESPYARCVRRNQPVAFQQPDSGTMERAGRGRRNVLGRYQAFLAVPMSVEGAPNGLITFARATRRAAFGAEETAWAVALAGHAGGFLADASRAMALRQTAEALRRGPLPLGAGLPGGLQIAGRCLPAAGNLAGGDWYDVVPLPGGRTGVFVGDVMGHGPSAAALMAQLRAAAHALAGAGLQPAELLRQLDSTAATLGDVVYATCAYAVIDPGADGTGGAATVALAGHLPPVLATPDGVTRVPELPTGLSLGLGSAAFGQVRIKLTPGTVLALFTDGLVETRTRPFDVGIRALRGMLARQHGTLNEACDTIISSLAPDLEDDTTIVLVRIPVSPGRS